MDRFKATKRVAVLGIAANLLLLILKLSIGLLSRSQAMIADGFNSAGDVFASVMTYTGNKIAGKPEDHSHPYGHGKAEYIFSMIISFSLLLIAYKIFRNSLDSILTRQVFTFSWMLIGVAVFTIVIKAFLFAYTKNVGTRIENLLILANSEDHRNDMFVTSSTLAGVFLSKYGLYWFDGAVGIGIALWIVCTGIRIFISSYKVLMDTNFDETYKSMVVKTLNTVEGIDHIDDIISKPVGVGFIIIIKVSVPGYLTVNEGHRIAAIIREKLRNCRNVKDVIVHINPA